ncbi:hypothetical protein H632_c3080p0 [Helicosporidium sp. ATCC 50920]|nr:hypothetical protein H632_c3080p0 [Helicosporidium sp. ATCC 50920]|eukprot:KDD72647.1 hypothetical protein H632_c3080p0 [Helicosporidium sp. ATCC 50920]
MDGGRGAVENGRGAVENGSKNDAKDALPRAGHLRPEALALAQRFFGGEPGAAPGLRDRLKLVPHVVNVDDWAKRAPLSRYEHRLLQSYNDKPILSRPQHRFYAGADYFEMDIDVHSYAFVARKALHGFLDRLRHVVLDVGFVVQGNAPEELPEGLLAAVRVADICWDRAHVLDLSPGAELAEDALGDDQGFLGVD